MIGIVLAIIYASIFIFLIRRLSFFQIEGISRNALSTAFIVKIIFGMLFWAVYRYYSRYQHYADAFLYFDDGKAIYQALFESPLDYLKILLGSDDPALRHYIVHTGQWDRMFNQGLYNETRTVIRFNAIADVFSFGNYHVHTVFMCFLSFFGLTGIYKTFTIYLADKKKELFIAVFFLPSVLFWGSGVLKEGLILWTMGMLLYHFHKLITEKYSFYHMAMILVFTWLLAITKIYLLLMLIPAFIAQVWVVKTRLSGRQAGNRKPVIKYLIVFALFLSAAMFQKKFDIPFMLMEKQRQSIYMSSGGSYLGIPEKNKFIYISPVRKNRIIPVPGKPGYCRIVQGVPYVSWYYENFTDSAYVLHSADTTAYWVYYNLEQAGSKIDIPFLYPSWSSIFKNTPVAFLTTAFRPHLLEIRNPLMLMSGIENFVILILIFLCIFFFSKKIKNTDWICFCISITLQLFVLIGLTTPILGAVVRYKIPALPFLLIAFLLILDKEKLLKKFPFLKKFIAL